MNKHFLDIICNKAWSSFELLTEVTHHTRERKDEREKVLYVTITRLVGRGAGDRGEVNPISSI